MPAAGITVLKNQVPWGPFTRAQIEDALARGDFNTQALAHVEGLPDWRPLREVLEFVDRAQPLPPVPPPREHPPIPAPMRVSPPQPLAPVSPPQPPPAISRGFPPAQPPPIMPVKTPVVPMSKPAGPPLPTPSTRVEPPFTAAVPPPAPRPAGIELRKASFFLRTVAFLVDCGILFLPLVVLYAVGALAIEIPDAIRHASHESRMESWELLEQNTKDLALYVAVGFGWLYAAGLESSRRQATVGKRWMGLKVTDAQGQRLTFLRATGRYAAKYLSALPCFLGFIMAMFGSRGRALHDRIADTRVVSD